MIDTNRTLPFVAVCSLVLAAALVLTTAVSGLGTRFGWWGFRTGLSLLRWSAYAELAVAAAAVIGCIFAYSRGQGSSLSLFMLAGIISIAAVIVPFRVYLIARSVPAIHDITTDTEDPPKFDIVLSMRKAALNPAEYGGPEIALQQKKAYPDIAPLLLNVPPARTFEKALSAVQTLGWEIVSVDPANGRIEATDTTFWFGFKDDIVIRITAQGNGSRVDLRSLSRVGRSDVGANADRIRRYLTALRKDT
ncbi:MAG: DUF1499 domain-containing protein [Nitrospirae bacterium]|nr:DUF1499 domain-containing protein [Nitrospirota bacterium]